MNAADWMMRGDPIEHEGVPTALEVLAWLVGGFWVLVGAIVFAVLYARRRRAARPDSDREHREHVAFVQGLHPGHARRAPAIMRGERGRVVLYPELSGVARTAGRHRGEAGKRRIS